MARLDRLGPAKELAQIGATIGREFSHALLAAVARKPETELVSALDRLVAAGLVFPRGVPPYATYLFKHALVQDAAYGTLLREPRRGLHARIAETLERKFVDISEAQPELLARHYTEAGQIEKAAGFWGKAGQRSLGRSALIEGVAQLDRALGQIATLPTSPALRREQTNLQVALANALMHTKGYAAPDTKAALERAHTFIERAEALGEPAEDPLLLFSVLNGFWIANFVAFNGDAMRELAAQFLALAEKQGATVPLMIGHRVMGISLMYTGDIGEGRAHYDRVIALYDPAEHRPLATRFGQDVRVAILSWRAWAMWLLGHPEAALADADDALKDARETGHAATLMFALGVTSITRVWCGNFALANLQVVEEIALADEKGALFWKAAAMMHHSVVLALTDKASNAIQMLTSAIAAWRSTGTTMWMPLFLSYSALACAKLEQFDDAWRFMGEAMTAIETTKEKWCEAEIHRMAGEIALLSSEPDEGKAEAYFNNALAVARAQQAKSWELRAAMSLAQLWRDQGKLQQARELLAPVYGWFTRRVRHARSKGREDAAGGVGGVRPGPRHEDISRDQCRSLALPDNAAVICIFLCVTRCTAASLGGVPRGVQDRVRERQEGFFAANQCRRLWNDRPLVAALLLVLSLIVTRRRTPRRNEPRSALAFSGQARSKLANCLPRYRVVRGGFDARDLKEAKALLEELA